MFSNNCYVKCTYYYYLYIYMNIFIQNKIIFIIIFHLQFAICKVPKVKGYKYVS